jgi:hypothetical protein
MAVGSDLFIQREPPTRSEPRIDGFALERKDGETALVDSAERLAACEPLETLNSECELP